MPRPCGRKWTASADGSRTGRNCAATPPTTGRWRRPRAASHAWSFWRLDHRRVGRPPLRRVLPGQAVVNRGIGGQTTPQMVLRMRADVIALQPKVLVLLAGTNDLARNTGPITVAQTEDNIATIAELATAHGIKVVLSSVLPVSAYHYKERPTLRGPQTSLRPPDKIAEINRWLQEFRELQRARVPGLLAGRRRRDGHAEGGIQRRRPASERRRLRRDGAARRSRDCQSAGRQVSLGGSPKRPAPLLASGYGLQARGQ